MLPKHLDLFIIKVELFYTIEIAYISKIVTCDNTYLDGIVHGEDAEDTEEAVGRMRFWRRVIHKFHRSNLEHEQKNAFFLPVVLVRLPYL